MTSTPGHRAHRKENTFAAETQVMDLWDAGLSEQAIADQLGKSLSAVRRILHYMGAHESPGKDSAAMRLGSMQLAAAIHEARAGA